MRALADLSNGSQLPTREALTPIRCSPQFANKQAASAAMRALYTDGIVERSDQQGEFFGSERLESLVAARQDKTAQELVDAIFEAVYAFGEEAAWDDATVLVIKRAPV